jgi:redox-sensitive bicupin YhaK (pirin superfamily)
MNLDLWTLNQMRQKMHQIILKEVLAVTYMICKWVNLPKNNKMKDSHYQEISLSKIPVVQTPGGKGIVKVISAKAFDIQLVIETKNTYFIFILYFKN